jgi:hypothetical protein
MNSTNPTSLAGTGLATGTGMRLCPLDRSCQTRIPHGTQTRLGKSPPYIWHFGDCRRSNPRRQRACNPFGKAPATLRTHLHNAAEHRTAASLCSAIGWQIQFWACHRCSRESIEGRRNRVQLYQNVVCSPRIHSMKEGTYSSSSPLPSNPDAQNQGSGSISIFHSPRCPHRCRPDRSNHRRHPSFAIKNPKLHL